MADTYIDYFEVGEYGNHFVNQAATLEGTSPLVDIVKLRARVGDAVTAVDSELTKAGVTRSGLRGGSGSASELSAGLRDVLERFYYHLRSLPKTTELDFEAFFPRRNLGNLSQLKPADMLSRGAAVVRGFASNSTLTGLANWRAELAAAHLALAATLDSKGGAKTQSINATTALQAARENFLKVYNRVAKRLVKGILIDLGRESEYRLFFLDLQVDEGPNSVGAEADTEAEAEADTEAEAP